MPSSTNCCRLRTIQKLVINYDCHTERFLEACNTLSTLRLIVTSSAAVLEACFKIESFYAELPKVKLRKYATY